jgi:hypothetical protein
MKKTDIYQSLLVYITDWLDDLTEEDMWELSNYMDGLRSYESYNQLKEYTRDWYVFDNRSEAVKNIISGITGISE